MYTATKLIYVICYNVMGSSITIWLVSLWNSYTLTLAFLTGLSLLVINVFKIRGMIIDQKIKLKELKEPKFITKGRPVK